MRHNFLTTIRRVAVLAGLVFTAACSTDATAPAAPAQVDPALARRSPDRSLLALVKVLPRNHALNKTISSSATIGAAGGEIKLPQVGFSLVIPAGALSANTQITVTADSGSGVAYRFEPHGLEFNKTVWFTQELKHTKATPLTLMLGAYFKNPDQLNLTDLTALIDELFGVRRSGGKLLFGIEHFSGYLVSCA